MPKYETEMIITVAGEENAIGLAVMYDYLPAEYGRRGDYGMQMEPDYPEAVDIWEVYGEYDGEALYLIKWLSKAQIRALELDILNTYKDY